MDKTLFNKKLEPLGYLKRRWGGGGAGAYEDTQLKLFPRNIDCPPCSHVEFSYKSKRWTRKCTICGEKIEVSRVIDK